MSTPNLNSYSKHNIINYYSTYSSIVTSVCVSVDDDKYKNITLLIF